MPSQKVSWDRLKLEINIICNTESQALSHPTNLQYSIEMFAEKTVRSNIPARMKVVQTNAKEDLR